MNPRVLLLTMTAAVGLMLSGLLAVDPEPRDWGTVKGQVVFAEPVIPANPPVAVGRMRACLAKGPILKNELVVNAKNRGVRWALVWLTGVDDPKGKKSIPTHKSLEKRAKSVELDIPCCVFEPRVLGMREGQTLLVKNSSTVAHAAGFDDGGARIVGLRPPKANASYANLKARTLPLIVTCSIHPWMKAYVGVFKHPYFTVTDADGNFTLKNAPAGKYRLMIWQEEAGWVIINRKDLKDRGKVIRITGSETTDLGKIPLVRPPDE